MNRYQAYPKYKASGVEWLGDVPEHWEVIQIKHLSTVNRGASPRPIDDEKYFDDNGEYAWVRIADVSSSNGVLRETTQRLSELGNSLSVKIHEGDLFISIAGTVGKPCISAIKACIHDGFVYFPTLTIPPIFLYRIFEAGLCYGGLGKFGTQLNLNTETIGAIRIALPNSNLELTQVLDFLETQTAKIDTLIAKQQRMIDLLGEKRQALVDYAINQKETIDSRLCFVVDEILRPVDRAKHDLYESLGLYNRGRGIFHKSPKTDEELGDSDFYWVEEGDLILSGQFAWEGAIAIAKKSENNCIVSHRYPILRGKAGEINTEYLWAYLTTKTGDSLLNECSVGSAGRNRPLNIGILLKEKIPVPIMSVQLEVAKIVKAEQILKVSVDKVITLLQERRSALISAAVTGKIDVRELA